MGQEAVTGFKMGAEVCDPKNPVDLERSGELEEEDRQ